MASGKETPRQKMINLMYLIFIAMLALNMSKEVLAAFGLMNEKMEASNAKAKEGNLAFLENLEVKASEDAAKYAVAFKDAQRIKELSDEFDTYLENLKASMVEKIEDRTDYEVMDKSDYLDEKFFQGDNLAEEGKRFLDFIHNYQEEVLQILGDRFPEVSEAVKTRFQTGDENGKVKRRDGVEVDWINYHYEGFPLIASLTKLTSLQADIKATEEAAFKAMLKVS